MERELDKITIENETGDKKDYWIEGLFDMEDDTYALLSSSDDEMYVMKVEEQNGEQYLVGVDDPEEQQNILNAYEIALEADPDDENYGPH